MLRAEESNIYAAKNNPNVAISRIWVACPTMVAKIEAFSEGACNGILKIKVSYSVVMSYKSLLSRLLTESDFEILISI
jgi:hypothetical protein